MKSRRMRGGRVNTSKRNLKVMLKSRILKIPLFESFTTILMQKSIDIYRMNTIQINLIKDQLVDHD
jgi:hypothetical protein